MKTGLDRFSGGRRWPPVRVFDALLAAVPARVAQTPLSEGALFRPDAEIVRGVAKPHPAGRGSSIGFPFLLNTASSSVIPAR